MVLLTKLELASLLSVIDFYVLMIPGQSELPVIEIVPSYRASMELNPADPLLAEAEF